MELDLSNAAPQPNSFIRRLWSLYADALFLSGDYRKAKTMCERTLEGAHGGDTVVVTNVVVLPHLNLSFILHDLGIEHGEQQRYAHFS